MITAVEEQRLQAQERSKRRAAGPQFSVPEAAGLTTLSLSAAPVQSCGFAAANTASPAPVAAGTLSQYLGQSVGTGQCVALVESAAPFLGRTAEWAPGALVQGNAALPPGTPIATFDAADRYANALDGRSHAALYLGQDAHGMQVLDQWAGRPAGVRTIPWTNPGRAAADTGSAYRVIQKG